jgi:hypothetical protein
MTEGGIAGWTKNEGEIFTAGDVLLEIVRTLPAPSKLKVKLMGWCRRLIKLRSTWRLRMMVSWVRSL